jgi:hypothetical protein
MIFAVVLGLGALAIIGLCMNEPKCYDEPLGVLSDNNKPKSNEPYYWFVASFWSVVVVTLIALAVL